MLMLLEATRYLPSAFGLRRLHEVLYQMYVTGIKSLGVITVVAAVHRHDPGPADRARTAPLQPGGQHRHGGQWSMLREMGPFMTGLILAASVGSAIAAQLGTMVVSEEIAALEIMSINPVRFLVMPRLVGPGGHDAAC